VKRGTFVRGVEGRHTKGINPRKDPMRLKCITCTKRKKNHPVGAKREVNMQMRTSRRGGSPMTIKTAGRTGSRPNGQT